VSSFYENLRVYKKTFELVSYFETIVRNFDRYHKHAIGLEFRSLSRSILVLIAKANEKERRKACLDEVIDKLEELKILVRVGKEVKAFRSFKSYEFATRLIIDISKQCEGWLKSQNAKGKWPSVER